jgi:hypothetical protein
MQPRINGKRGKVFPVGLCDTTVEELFGEVFSAGLCDVTIELLGEVFCAWFVLRCYK